MQNESAHGEMLAEPPLQAKGKPYWVVMRAEGSMSHDLRSFPVKVSISSYPPPVPHVVLGIFRFKVFAVLTFKRCPPVCIRCCALLCD